jgi:hypothetical protein
MSRVPTLAGHQLTPEDLALLRREIEGGFDSMGRVDDGLRSIVAEFMPDLLHKLPADPGPPAELGPDDTVRLQHLTDEHFDGPHPNPWHIVGVTYDPRERCAYVPTPWGEVRANIGDLILQHADGSLHVEHGQVEQ